MYAAFVVTAQDSRNCEVFMKKCVFVLCHQTVSIVISLQHQSKWTLLHLGKKPNSAKNWTPIFPRGPAPTEQQPSRWIGTLTNNFLQVWKVFPFSDTGNADMAHFTFTSSKLQSIKCCLYILPSSGPLSVSLWSLLIFLLPPSWFGPNADETNSYFLFLNI